MLARAGAGLSNLGMSHPSVALIGLGIIGGIWARHYADAGQLAATWNRTPKPGIPARVDSPTLAACAAKILHICVADPKAVEGVLETILPKLTSEHLVIQSSTIDPTSSLRFEEMVTATGAAYVEAPFTGSKPAAEQRKIVFYLGGETVAKDRAWEILSTIGATRFDCGTTAQAAALKLAMNLNISIIMNGLAESLEFARRSGIPDDLYFSALGKNVSHSGLADLKEPKLRTDDYSTQFSVKHLLKDVRLALSEDAGAELPLTHLSAVRLAAAANAGWADDDFSSIIRLLRTQKH
jgi:3-hydroxyisobutyrate dehydrogenase-like beta-hydroxyacid dehydrogenase